MANSVIDVGGVLLCIGGAVTVLYLTQDANFGFIVPILQVMIIGVTVAGMGLLAMARPRYSPVAGSVAIFVSLGGFVAWWDNLLWAVPTFLGGLACIVGWPYGWFIRQSEEREAARQ